MRKVASEKHYFYENDQIYRKIYVDIHEFDDGSSAFSARMLTDGNRCVAMISTSAPSDLTTWVSDHTKEDGWVKYVRL